jgi:hypothetical protein
MELEKKRRQQQRRKGGSEGWRNEGMNDFLNHSMLNVFWDI